MEKNNRALWMGLFVVLMSVSYGLGYYEKQNTLYAEAKNIFIKEAPYWADSVFSIGKIPCSGYYDLERYRNKKVHHIVTAKDTIEISSTFYFPNDFWRYHHEMQESVLILYGMERGMEKVFDMARMDSLFQTALEKGGIKAEAGVELQVRDLHAMFPDRERMCHDVPVVNVLRKKSVEGGVTDTVEIGICGHGQLTGHINLPVITTLAAMPLWGRWQFGGVVLFLLVWVIVWGMERYKTVVKPYMKNVSLLGNTLFDFNTKNVHLGDGGVVSITSIQIQFLKMLLDAAPQYVVSKEEICRKLWGRDMQNAQNSYNALISTLRKNLFSHDNALELKTQTKEGVELAIDKDGLKILPKWVLFARFFSIFLRNPYNKE